MSDTFAELRRREFGRLDAGGHAYLDYTGAGLYPESVVREHADSLCSSILGNPHSRNPASGTCTDRVEDVRKAILKYFNADARDYQVVFTANATGAIKLVAEAFPFREGSRFVLTADNHNSVAGVRQYAARAGAQVRTVPLDDDLRISCLQDSIVDADRSRPNLLSFPAQSNFSGVKHPLEWISQAQAAGFRVMLDAAALVPTSALDLGGAHRPDFVCLSFYKMIGFPTGVGVLLARKDALEELERPWFAGGTVRYAAGLVPMYLLHDGARGFEDGTLNYLGIIAAGAGLEFLRKVGIGDVNAHVMRLTGMMLERLRGLAHSNGRPMIEVYGPRDLDRRGATVAFNVLDPDGAVHGFLALESAAGERRVYLRGGFFCNPGAAATALHYDEAREAECTEGQTADTFQLPEFSACMDRAGGALRASLGIASNAADIDRLIAFLREYRDAPAVPLAGLAAAQITAD